MTTQVLMSNCSTLSQATANPAERSIVEVSTSTAEGTGSTSLSPKLPYQTSHQVEWLHLQAEAEALLQQLIELKQQRHETEVPELAESPVLAGR